MMATNTITGHVEVFLSATALPFTHNPDCIVVIPHGPAAWKRKEPYPVASIVSLSGGEPIGARPRGCIHVTVEDHELYIRNGLIAVERHAPLMVCRTPFPELSGQLQNNPEGLTDLIEVQSYEKPWTRVKSFHQGDSDFEINGAFIGPCEAFNALVGWNRFEKEDWKWHKRVDHVLGLQTRKPSCYASTQKRFERLCKRLGLKRNKMNSFGVQERELHACIEIALQGARESAAI